MSLRSISVLSYTLHSIVAIAALLPGVQVSVVLLLIAFIIDLVKRDDERGTWQESHFRYRIRSVLIAGLLYALTSPLWILLIAPGWAAWALISLWFAYRIVKGFLRLLDEQPALVASQATRRDLRMKSETRAVNPFPLLSVRSRYGASAPLAQW